ncbi:MAG: HEPN domain-containing protein [Bacteroidota bacterium]|nr:HEPN domain-containing protein [Bacteroidota bacterium]
MSRVEAAIELKLKKAKALMDEVDFQLRNGFYNTVINRLYYSCFHATKALLLTQDSVPKTHSWVSTLLHQKFVTTGMFNPSFASFFNKLMNERIDDDYSDFMITEPEEIEPFILPGKEYLDYTISVVRNIINSDKSSDSIVGTK